MDAVVCSILQRQLSAFRIMGSFDPEVESTSGNDAVNRVYNEEKSQKMNCHHRFGSKLVVVSRSA
jgi:hypothetical protein